MTAARPDQPAGAMHWRRRELTAVLAISALAVALRLHGIEQWSWSAAEALTWRALTQPLLGAGGFFGGDQGLWPTALLGLRWLCASGWLPSHGEGWLRLPFAFAGALAIPLLAVLGRRMVGSAPALLAAACLALHPLHIAASQSAAPAVVAVTVAIAAATAATRGRNWLAWTGTVLAGSCHPVGYALGLAALCGPRAGPRAAYVWSALVALAAPLLLEGPLVLRAPAVIAAALAVPLIGPAAPRVLLLVLLPLALGTAAWLCGAAPAAAQLAALPGLLLAAAAGAHAASQRLAAPLLGAGRPAHHVAALPAVLLAVDLAVGAFLYTTLHRGWRPPWRAAAQELLAVLRERPELDVRAAAGQLPLLCYLRPGHWVSARVDPHPGRRVRDLPSPGDAEVIAGALAGEEGGSLLVLVQPELEQLRANPRAAATLAAYRVRSVLPAPQPGADQTIYVLQRAAD